MILFNVNEATKTLESGDHILFNTSLTSWAGGADRSSANAFQLETFIYYDSQFVTLKSMDALDLTNGSLSPSDNTSTSGFVHLKNSAFGPFNAQLVQFKFLFTVPEKVRKWKNCAGRIIFEFKYRSNSVAFNGTWNKTLDKVIDYRCKIRNKPKNKNHSSPFECCWIQCRL